eukprot:jgi/Mesvir1/11657/Mv00055-RA.1
MAAYLAPGRGRQANLTMHPHSNACHGHYSAWRTMHLAPPHVAPSAAAICHRHSRAERPPLSVPLHRRLMAFPPHGLASPLHASVLMAHPHGLTARPSLLHKGSFPGTLLHTRCRNRRDGVSNKDRAPPRAAQGDPNNDKPRSSPLGTGSNSSPLDNTTSPLGAGNRNMSGSPAGARKDAPAWNNPVAQDSPIALEMSFTQDKLLAMDESNATDAFFALDNSIAKGSPMSSKAQQFELGARSKELQQGVIRVQGPQRVRPELQARGGWSARLFYNIDKIWSSSPLNRFVLFALITTGLLLLGTSLMLATGDFSVPDSAWRAFLFIIDPGSAQLAQGSAQRFIAGFLCLLGLVNFGGFVGLSAEAIATRIEELDRGFSDVLESDHIVILGYNSKVFVLVMELVEANRTEGGVLIVMLSSKSKSEMQSLWLREVAALHSMSGRAPGKMPMYGSKVICRQGDPQLVSDLLQVNVLQARSVIVLTPDTIHSPEDRDAEVLRVCLALETAAVAGKRFLRLHDDEHGHRRQSQQAGGWGGGDRQQVQGHRGAETPAIPRSSPSLVSMLGLLPTKTSSFAASTTKPSQPLPSSSAAAAQPAQASTSQASTSPSSPPQVPRPALPSPSPMLAYGHVVAEAESRAHVDALQYLGRDRGYWTVHHVVSRELLGRLMVQGIFMPGITHVYAHLLGFVGNEFYFLPMPPHCAGSRLSDIIACCVDGIPCGVWDPVDGLLLCPGEDFVVQAHHSLVVLAEDNDKLTMVPTPMVTWGPEDEAWYEIRVRQQVTNRFRWKRLRELLQQIMEERGEITRLYGPSFCSRLVWNGANLVSANATPRVPLTGTAPTSAPFRGKLRRWAPVEIQIEEDVPGEPAARDCSAPSDVFICGSGMSTASNARNSSGSSSDTGDAGGGNSSSAAAGGGEGSVTGRPGRAGRAARDIALDLLLLLKVLHTMAGKSTKEVAAVAGAGVPNGSDVGGRDASGNPCVNGVTEWDGDGTTGTKSWNGVNGTVGWNGTNGTNGMADAVVNASGVTYCAQGAGIGSRDMDSSEGKGAPTAPMARAANDAVPSQRSAAGSQAVGGPWSGGRRDGATSSSVNGHGDGQQACGVGVDGSRGSRSSATNNGNDNSRSEDEAGAVPVTPGASPPREASLPSADWPMLSSQLLDRAEPGSRDVAGQPSAPPASRLPNTIPPFPNTSPPFPATSPLVRTGPGQGTKAASVEPSRVGSTGNLPAGPFAPPAVARGGGPPSGRPWVPQVPGGDWRAAGSTSWQPRVTPTPRGPEQSAPGTADGMNGLDGGMLPVAQQGRDKAGSAAGNKPWGGRAAVSGLQTGAQAGASISGGEQGQVPAERGGTWGAALNASDAQNGGDVPTGGSSGTSNYGSLNNGSDVPVVTAVGSALVEGAGRVDTGGMGRLEPGEPNGAAAPNWPQTSPLSVRVMNGGNAGSNLQSSPASGSHGSNGAVTANGSRGATSPAAGVTIISASAGSPNATSNDGVPVTSAVPQGVAGVGDRVGNSSNSSSNSNSNSNSNSSNNSSNDGSGGGSSSSSGSINSNKRDGSSSRGGVFKAAGVDAPDAIVVERFWEVSPSTDFDGLVALVAACREAAELAEAPATSTPGPGTPSGGTSSAMPASETTARAPLGSSATTTAGASVVATAGGAPMATPGRTRTSATTISGTTASPDGESTTTKPEGGYPAATLDCTTTTPVELVPISCPDIVSNLPSSITWVPGSGSLPVAAANAEAETKKLLGGLTRVERRALLALVDDLTANQVSFDPLGTGMHRWHDMTVTSASNDNTQGGGSFLGAGGSGSVPGLSGGSASTAAPMGNGTMSHLGQLSPAWQLPQRVLVCGWPNDVETIIFALDQYLTPGSEVTFMSPVDPEVASARLRERGHFVSRRPRNININFASGDPGRLVDLQRLRVEQFAAVMITADMLTAPLSGEAPDINDADTKAIFSAALIRHVQQLRRAGKPSPCAFVTELRGSRAKGLSKLPGNVASFVFLNELTSMALAMVAEDARASELMRCLFEQGRYELYMQLAVPRYVAEGEAACFAQLQKRAGLGGEVLLGYWLKGATRSTLNPMDKAVKRLWSREDRLVLLSAVD